MIYFTVRTNDILYCDNVFNTKLSLEFDCVLYCMGFDYSVNIFMSRVSKSVTMLHMLTETKKLLNKKL